MRDTPLTVLDMALSDLLSDGEEHEAIITLLADLEITRERLTRLARPPESQVAGALPTPAAQLRRQLALEVFEIVTQTIQGTYAALNTAALRYRAAKHISGPRLIQ